VARVDDMSERSEHARQACGRAIQNSRKLRAFEPHDAGERSESAA